jgi:hypothetical protein
MCPAKSIKSIKQKSEAAEPQPQRHRMFSQQDFSNPMTDN